MFKDDRVYRIEYKYSKDGSTVIGINQVVIKDGLAFHPVRHGGGCGNVTGLALGFFILLLHRELMPFRFMDEPLVNSDYDKWVALNQIILSLNQDQPLQFMAITHSGAKLDKTYRVRMRGGISYVEEVTET
jgi:hypothetical protein